MIFDIDGTLVDTNPAHVDAWRRAFRRLETPATSMPIWIMHSR
jgi:beta-phosphoglucomutase-like phosphatase (HAD superfamily)